MRKPILYISIFILLYIANIYFAQQNYPRFLLQKPAQVAPKTQEPDDLMPLPYEEEGEDISLSPRPEPDAPEEETLPPNEEDFSPRRPLDTAALDAANLVDVETLPIKVFLDIRYATADNFTGEKLYDNAKCYLEKATADVLTDAAGYALDEETPFYLCIYDCYRPLSVQRIMYAKFPEPGYVANPDEGDGSNHNRGAAVDVGPCNESGINLPMPTDFDSFEAKSAAFSDDPEIPKTALKNREMLQRVMRKAGFRPTRKEWWHFDFIGAKDYPLLDIPI